MQNVEDVCLDISRCEKVLSEKVYLEIIIAIEEFQDKYRNKIKYISESCNDVVWNYSTKDLENIKNHLEKYKEELIEQAKLKNINEKISQLRLYTENNEIENEEDLRTIVNTICDINNKNITVDEKYEVLKEYLCMIKIFDRQVSVHLLELITLVLK